MMVQLSKRLTAVAGMVTKRGVLADVGTDHGYIPVFLAGRKQILRAIAMDVNEGPLQRAKEHVRQYGLENKIETRLSDGLAALQPKEADSIVIAGMGGSLMKRILQQREVVARSAKELILQPQSELMELRKFLWESGYQIEAEDIVFEDGKYYPMMRAVYSEEESRMPDMLELKYGKMLLEQKHPVLGQYLQRQKEQKEEILQRLQQNARQDISSRYAEVELELVDIKHALELTDGAKNR